MRVGILSLLHESNTFLPETTPFEAFERDHVRVGAAVAELFAGGHHEVSGFLEGLRRHGVEAVPLFAARAVPSGTIEAAAADRLANLMLARLDSAGSLDGLLVALHGAAVAENHRDFDGHLLARLRNVFGPDRPIIATLDPHANLSPAMVTAADALIAYRTNPHLDQKERGLEAATLMTDTLAGRIQPLQAAALPPIAIGIESQHTGRPPARWLDERAEAWRRREGILSVSVILGFPYADVAEMGSGFVVVANGSQAAAREAAAALAEDLWSERARFSVGAADAASALAQLGADTQGRPVGLLDIGDNVGGGSPGDGTLLAHAIAERGNLAGFVCLWDPASVEAAAAAGTGTRIRLNMGGHSGAQGGPPIDASVTVLSLHDGRYREPEARHGGMSDFDMGPTAVVRTDRRLTVMLTSRRVMPVSLAQLTSCGLDPRCFEVIVLKGVHAPVAAYEPVCARLILVDTPGVTRCRLDSFDYRHRRRPLYPLERDGIMDLKQVLVP